MLGPALTDGLLVGGTSVDWELGGDRDEVLAAIALMEAEED